MTTRKRPVVHEMKQDHLRWVVAMCNWRITQRISYNGKGVTCKRCLKRKSK